MSAQTLWQICAVFGAASLLSFGGGNAIVPQLQLQTVVEHQWLTAVQFADSFAIAQVAPGPSVLLVTLLGYHVAGFAGALLATVAMILPAAILVAIMSRVWTIGEHSHWHVAVERGLAPVAIGLIAASGIVIAGTVDHRPIQWVISTAATLLLSLTKLNPVLVVAGGGLLAMAWGGA
ncbi:MAG: chromate transporter [Acetobacteraceae bacterium]|nr:chromate transporter [Acetobacteraceae bacterium]